MTNFFDRIVLAEERTIETTTALGPPILEPGARLLSETPYSVALVAQDWHFGVLIPIKFIARDAATDLLVARFRVTVTDGDVRVGCVDSTLGSFLRDEIEIYPQTSAQEIDVELPDAQGYVVFRTSLTKDGRSPVLEIHDTRVVAGKRAVTGAIIDVLPMGTPPLSRRQGEPVPPDLNRLDLIVSHSTRRFDFARASAAFLRERYANRERLLALPDFESLPSASTAHALHGALTHFRLRLAERHVELETVRCIDSRELVEQAAVVGGRLVICANSFLCVLPSLEHRLTGREFDEGSPYRIDDPWFAGLHTVVAVGEDECLVSAAGPDAALRVDLIRGMVTQRYRLPASIYGANYELTPGTSVHDHYIPNDYQLGHLNSAYPDERGGCYVTTLGQGDVGHFDREGTYKLIASGYVGLHGLRRSIDERFLYFTESPTGRLWKIDDDGSVQLIAEVNTSWLHDAQQISQDVFACLPVDRNELVFVDVRRKTEIAAFDLASRGLNPQFISVVKRAASAD